MSGTKYQVFISSTYDDLKAERDRVTKAILEMGNIPVGMEMFSAADDEQWKIIQSHIDSSDYYVVIVAHRYGSMIEGVSFTEREYDYAVSIGIPVLGFLIDQQVRWEPSLIEADKKELLDAFKTKVRKKPVATWKSAEDLYGQVAIALMKQITARPRPGWIRGSNAASAATLEELSRLSAENSSLRESLKVRHPPDLAFHVSEAVFNIADVQGTPKYGSVDAKVFVSNRDGQSASLPLDLVETEVQVEDQIAYLRPVIYVGEPGHILVAVPQEARLVAMLDMIPQWLETSTKLKVTWRFIALGFDSVYTVVRELRQTDRDSWAFPDRPY
jgi:hypothetical protein